MYECTQEKSMGNSSTTSQNMITIRFCGISSLNNILKAPNERGIIKDDENHWSCYYF